MRVLLIGEEAAGLQVLRALASTGNEVVGVVTSGRSEPGRVSLKSAARDLGYPTWPAYEVRDPGFAQKMAASDLDLLLNVHSLAIVPASLLGSCRIGAFNLHPGPLPQYAGLNVVSWAIYRQESQHAVTLHWMDQTIDTGDIAYQASFPIEPHDTPLLLTFKCIRAGVPLVEKLLDTATRDRAAIPRLKQDLAQRQWFGKEVPQGGRLCWGRTAREIVAFVRACDYAPYPSPWGHPRAAVGECDLAITKADWTGLACNGTPGTVGQCSESGSLVTTRDEWVAIRQVKIDGQTCKPGTILRSGLQLFDGR